MSGILEGIGVAASLVQLLGVVTSVGSLITQLRDTHLTLQSRMVHVQNLIDIINLIARKPQLQTKEVELILRKCLKEAETLRGILERAAALGKEKSLMGRWGRAASAFVKEKKVVDLLEGLEREKKSLVLCIMSVDS